MEGVILQAKENNGIGTNKISVAALGADAKMTSRLEVAHEKSTERPSTKLKTNWLQRWSWYTSRVSEKCCKKRVKALLSLVWNSIGGKTETKLIVTCKHVMQSSNSSEYREHKVQLIATQEPGRNWNILQHKTLNLHKQGPERVSDERREANQAL